MKLVERVDDCILGKILRDGRRRDRGSNPCQILFSARRLQKSGRQRLKDPLDSRHIRRNVHDDIVQREQNEHRDRHLDTGAGRIDAVLRVNHLCLVVHLLHRDLIGLSLVLLLDCVQLRLHQRRHSGKLLLTVGERKHRHENHEGEQNDSQTDVADPD